MGPGAVDWGPALGVLLVGLVVGAVMMWRVYAAGRKADAAARDAELSRRDLLARRDVLLTQLRELDDSRRPPVELARERYALELSAAGVLRSLTGLGEAVSSDEAASPQAAAPRKEAEPGSEEAPAAQPSALRGFAWGVGSAAVLGLLMHLVSGSATPREEGASPTGGTGETAGMAPQPAPDPALRQLMAAVEANPDDLDARVALARGHLEREDMMSVFSETQYVLERAPEHPEALAYQALVRLAMGQADVAEEMLKRSIASAPQQTDAYLHLALVYYRLGRVEEGEAILADLRERHPEHGDMLDRIAVDLQSQAGAGVASGDAHAGIEEGQPAMAPSAPPPAPVGGAAVGPRIAGVLDLAPELQGSVSGVLYLIVREPGGEGPPVAVKRLVPSGFPMGFEVSSADSMMGGELPERLWLEVRLDGDGDAMTKDPADPKVVVDGVALGNAELRLTLSR